MTVLVVTMGDDWQQIMYSYQRHSYYTATLYFMLVFTVNGIILLQLSIAIMLSVFEQDFS